MSILVLAASSFVEHQRAALAGLAAGIAPRFPLQGQRMAQHVALMVLRFARELPQLELRHAAAEWRRPLPADEDQGAVGVMGYGSIGAPAADRNRGY